MIYSILQTFFIYLKVYKLNYVKIWVKLYANTSFARIGGKRHKCPLRPPKATRLCGRVRGFYAPKVRKVGNKHTKTLHKGYLLTSSGDKNILAVVDRKPVLENLRRRIKSEGKFNFFGAISYAEAKKIIDKNSFFACIVDLEICNEEGKTVADLTLEHSIPTIVLTGIMNKALRDNILSKPIIDYIHKDTLDNVRYAAKLISRLNYFYGQKALIVDDSKTSCTYIANSFKRLLFNPIECTNPLDAIDILTVNPDIKIVTIDYEMPGINGVDLCKKIRTTFPDREIVLFGISSLTLDEVKYGFLKSGASSFFIKPIVKEEFLAKIINHMQIIEQQEKLNTYIDRIDKHIITSISDASNIIKYVSHAFCEASGYDKSELLEQNHAILEHPDMSAQTHQHIWQTITNGVTWNGEIKNIKKNGDYYWLQANIEPIFDNVRTITGFQLIGADISDKKTIELMSITDELTGLYNRRFFNATIIQRLDEAKTKKRCFVFFIMDVDNFKKYNDTYGHKMGDDVLKAVGKVMKESLLMEGDIPFRIGGEEFGGIVYTNDFEEAKSSVESVRKELEELKIEHSKNTASPYVTASFGLIFVDLLTYANKDITSEEIYIKADEALYEAKESGRNKVVTVSLT